VKEKERKRKGGGKIEIKEQNLFQKVKNKGKKKMHET
jgi:hypothetical protein